MVPAGRADERGEFDVLAALRRTGKPYTLTPGELAKSTMVTNAAMTNRLSRREGKGLLQRRTDTNNRRNVLVSLTEDGLELVDRVVDGHFDNERKILASLTADEQEQLAAPLEQFLEASGDLADPN